MISRAAELVFQPTPIRLRCSIRECVNVSHVEKSKHIRHIQQKTRNPLVNIQKTMERSAFLKGKSTISMVIFNSYVKLTEGTLL